MSDEVIWTARLIRRVVGARVLGIYQHGSAATGELRPASDLDFLAVTSQPLRQAERAQLVTGLLTLSGTDGNRPLELTVVTHRAVRPWRYLPVTDLLFGEWLREQISRQGPPGPVLEHSLPITIAQARATGNSLWGPPATALLDPVPTEDLMRAGRDAIPSLLGDLDGDERNVLLTLARIWVTATTGQVLVKDEAATWAAEQLPHRLRGPLEHARLLYRTSTYRDETWPAGLLEQVPTTVTALCERIEKVQ